MTRRRTDDLAELSQMAIAAINEALKDGDDNGKQPGTWRDAETYIGRIMHADEHLALLSQGDTKEDHLTHAICDLVIAYAHRSSERLDAAVKRAIEQGVREGFDEAEKAHVATK